MTSNIWIQSVHTRRPAKVFITDQLDVDDFFRLRKHETQQALLRGDGDFDAGLDLLAGSAILRRDQNLTAFCSETGYGTCDRPFDVHRVPNLPAKPEQFHPLVKSKIVVVADFSQENPWQEEGEDGEVQEEGEDGERQS